MLPVVAAFRSEEHKVSNLASPVRHSISTPHPLTSKLHLHTHSSGLVLERLIDINCLRSHPFDSRQPSSPERRTRLCDFHLPPWTMDVSQVLESTFSPGSCAIARGSWEIVECPRADRYCADASARQNAEQQLSQAAELNLVRLSLLFGVAPRLCAL